MIDCRNTAEHCPIRDRLDPQSSFTLSCIHKFLLFVYSRSQSVDSDSNTRQLSPLMNRPLLQPFFQPCDKIYITLSPTHHLFFPCPVLCFILRQGAKLHTFANIPSLQKSEWSQNLSFSLDGLEKSEIPTSIFPNLDRKWLLLSNH